MKRTVELLLLIPILIFISLNAGAAGTTNATDENLSVPLHFLPDSIKEIISNRKFILYDYGHHGMKWCIIYEEGDSYNFIIGTTRKEQPYSAVEIDAAGVMAAHWDLIRWGIYSLPYITKNMECQYRKEWFPIYHSLSVFYPQFDCIFNADNVIGFKARNHKKIDKNFLDLCYFMYWLSAPEIRHLLPGFEDYIKETEPE